MAEPKIANTHGRRGRGGQAALEFAIIYAAVGIPLIFGTLLLSQLLWVWHSIAELTRDGARYAATHCWQPGGENVLQYMQTHVPPNLQMTAFQTGGTAQINIEYFSLDPDSGLLTPFTCANACSTACVPDSVSISVTNYQFTQYATLLKSITMPPFLTTQSIGSAGCDETGVCQ
jgi:hypothetical protein